MIGFIIFIFAVIIIAAFIAYGLEKMGTVPPVVVGAVWICAALIILIALLVHGPSILPHC